MPKLHFFTQADNQAEPTAPKPKYRLTNWPEYNKALVNRGFISIWLDETTLAQWYYQGPPTAGGLFRYSEECIQAALALKAVFRPHGRPRRFSANTGSDSEHFSHNEDGVTSAFLQAALSPTG